MEILKQRAVLLQSLRNFFEASGSLEVETPAIVASPGVDAHLDAIPAGDRWLTTSPEYHMKRLLAAGSGSIHQVGKAWRAGELGRLHEPEFTLLEWYRIGLDDQGLMDETEQLVCGAARSLGLSPSWLGEPFERISWTEAFRRHAGFDPAEEPVRRFGLLLRASGTRPPRDGSREDLEDLVLSTVVQPRLGIERPCFVTHWPADRAALARLHPGGKTAARFELYLSGLEICNGYHELTDPEEQRHRILHENARRELLGKAPYPVDEAFLAAIGTGLPDCAGNALGVDRLLMALLGVEDIGKVRSFRLGE